MSIISIGIPLPDRSALPGQTGSGEEVNLQYTTQNYCEGTGTYSPTVATPVGGTFTSSNPSGLAVNTSSGLFNLGVATPGNYTITYTVAGVGSANFPINITALDNAAFSYSATSFCKDASNQTPTITTPGGSFTTQDLSTVPLQLKFSVTSGVEKTIEVGITGTSYTIDWGDGTVQTGQTGGTKSHTYNPGGSGTTADPTISIGATPDTGPVTDFTIPVKADLLDIVAWGNLVWTGSWQYKFSGCTNLATPLTATDYPNVSNVSNFFGAFSSSNINGGLSNWVFNFNSTSVDFGRMFYIASSFNEDVSSWDVSGVSKFNDIFRSASSFSKNLSNWYVNGFSPNLPNTSQQLKFAFWNSAMTAEHFTDTIVGWAVAVRRDSGPYNVSAATVAPNAFITTRTQDTDNSGNTVNYSTKYGSLWDSSWNNAGDARQFLLNNGWTVS